MVSEKVLPYSQYILSCALSAKCKLLPTTLSEKIVNMMEHLAAKVAEI